MDRLSLKVLKHIAAEKDKVSRKSVVGLFGEAAQKSLTYLENDGFIKSGREPIGFGPNMTPVFASDGIFSITSEGIAFLEEKPGKDFDRWLTRFCAIWGAITGTAALILEAVLHFQ